MTPRFKVGDRVEMARSALRRGLGKPSNGPVFGTVVGHGRSPVLVKVQRDGYRGAENYHVTFWRRISEQQSPNAQQE